MCQIKQHFVNKKNGLSGVMVIKLLGSLILTEGPILLTFNQIKLNLVNNNIYQENEKSLKFF